VLRRIAHLAVFISIVSAPPQAAQTNASEREFVRVSPDGRGFAVGEHPWYPMGCNYFDPHVGWAPKMWREFDAAKVEEHFRVMRGLGVNVVRFFIAAQSFFPEPPNLEPDALKKFDAMLAIARRYGIRVHPTGPDAWEGNPPWRAGDIYADPKALDAQVAFWKAFAARYKDDPIIFAYDLKNEPHIGWRGPDMSVGWRAWLRERYGTMDGLRKAWGDEARSVQSFEAVAVPKDEAASTSVALLDFQHYREWLADRWTKLQVEAIRSVDPNHLITVGLIQWTVPVNIGKPSRYAAFRPSRIAPLVDFLSIHFYPLWGDPLASEQEFDRNLAYLELLLRYTRAGDPRKPLFVGEFGWYGGGSTNDRSVVRSAEDQARWCRNAVMQGRGISAGWLNWAYADTPSARDITKFSGLVSEDGKPKAWGEAFRELAKAPSVWTTHNEAPQAEVEFDVDRAIVDPEAGDATLRRYFESWKPAKSCGLRVR
jgi:endo-1,4-beta-mannosidase